MKYIGLNNSVVEAKDAVVSTLDHGFYTVWACLKPFAPTTASPSCCAVIWTDWLMAAGS